MVASYKIAVTLLMLLTTYTTTALWLDGSLALDNIDDDKRSYISSGVYKGETCTMRPLSSIRYSNLLNPSMVISHCYHLFLSILTVSL
jgi:hypothetical protein